MKLSVIFLLGVALLLAPLYAALPDDPLPIASSWLCTAIFAALFFAVIAAAHGDRIFFPTPNPAEKAFLILLGLAFLSIPARLIAEHGTGYLGPMLRGWEVLAADFTAFALARCLARERTLLYGSVLTTVAASAVVSEKGILEDLPYLLNHQATWRVFSTSTPDYLAGYLVMLLPLTLALFLLMPSLRAVLPLARHAATGILGLLIVFQLATLVATGSRFALLSLAIALIVFVLALKYATKQGLTLDRTTRALMGVLGAGLVVVVLVFARPVFLRLTNADPNSTAFRVWTWKGALKMAIANPLLGTGIGTWSDLYPKYALTGFTRLAHESYLQMADECGIPALLILLVTLGWLGLTLVRGLAISPAEAPTKEALQADYLPHDHRLLLCGLLASLAGGVVQNLSDSDWYVFFLGITFWALAGLASGICSLALSQTEIRSLRPLLVAAGSLAAVFALLAGAQGIAAVYALRAQKQAAGDPIGAARAYDIARAWDPVNATYPSDQGYKVYLTQNSLTRAEAALRAAVARAPNSVNYRRLGNILQTQGRQADALAAYHSGLHTDPNSLVLLLDLARLTPLPHALDYYRRVSELELTPVGTVRALGESVETRFVIADTVMGDQVAKTHPQQAAGYYARAAQGLERFADLGGSLNGQLQAMATDRPGPHLDAEMGGLYQHVLTGWIALTPPDQQNALRRRQEKYRQIFDTLFAQSSKQGTL